MLFGASLFQPTRPLRGATVIFCAGSSGAGISTHAPLAGRDYIDSYCKNPYKLISTHAPLAGRDDSDGVTVYTVQYISTHAPLAGRDVSTLGVVTSFIAFQPTRPLRGATFFPLLFISFCIPYFNPRAPCGARPFLMVGDVFSFNFNPRAPCGARPSVLFFSECSLDFNPRAPCGARPDLRDGYVPEEVISTHAPLAGRDSKRVQITMHIFAITDKFQMLLHRMPPVRAFCSFLMQENHADFGCEPPK